jgi:hypothetical protein
MTFTSWIRTLVATPAVMLCVGGCGSMTDGEYQGETLMRIDGSIVSDESNLPPMDVALLWQINPDAQGCERATDALARVKTEGMFPAAFRLLVTQPPPAGAFVGDSPVAEAYVAALDKDNRVYGYASNAGKVVYKVVYSKRDIAADSSDSVRFGGTGLRAGYQMGLWELSASSPVPVLRLAGQQDAVSIEIISSAGTPFQPVCGSPSAPGTAPTPTSPSN